MWQSVSCLTALLADCCEHIRVPQKREREPCANQLSEHQLRKKDPTLSALSLAAVATP
jgi:hypothetical protein